MTTEREIELLSNPSGKAWAEYFMECKAKNNWSADDIDEGLMIGWFSCAMMAMHDFLRPDLAPKVLPDGSAFFVADV